MLLYRHIISMVYALGFFILFPRDAMAQANVGEVADNIESQGGGVTLFLTSLCYVMGVWFVIVGLVKMRDYADDPDRAFLKNALAYLGAGAALILLPFSISLFLGTAGENANATFSAPKLYR